MANRSAKRQTSTRSISRRRAAFNSFFSLGRAETDLTDVHGNGPTLPRGILPQGATLHGLPRTVPWTAILALRPLLAAVWYLTGIERGGN